MYSAWMWAPSLRLPTHTALIYKSLSWLAEGAKAVSVSLVQVKKKLRWWLSGCQVYLKVPQIWMTALQHDWTLIFTRGKPDHSSNLKGRWFGPSPDILDQSHSHGRVHSPTENIQIYPLSQNLGQGYKLHVTSHCKDIEQNSSMEEAWTEERQRWKEAPGCHIESIVDFFRDPTCPIVEGNQSCLPVDVW